MEEFNKSGYTFFLGAFATGGPIITGYGPFGTSAESAVFYFQPEGKAMAEDVASIVSKVLSLKSMQTQLVDPSTMDNNDPRKFTLENSGLDLQDLFAQFAWVVPAFEVDRADQCGGDDPSSPLRPGHHHVDIAAAAL